MSMAMDAQVMDEPMIEETHAARRVVARLIESGWAMSTIAEHVGVDPKSVSRWLKGETVPKSKAVRRNLTLLTQVKRPPPVLPPRVR